MQERRRRHQKAGRGLTSCGPLHINWKGMKCQACFHHSETVKPLPPPPPPPSSFSFSFSHQPVTPQNLLPTSPPTPSATSHSHDQIIFQRPEICLSRPKSAADLALEHFWSQKKRSFFFFNNCDSDSYVCLLVAKQSASFSVYFSVFEQWLVKVPCFFVFFQETK